MHTENITAIALVLAAAVALGFAMSRVRMPAAAGFILVGVALEPLQAWDLIRNFGLHRGFGRSGRADASVHHRHGDAVAILPQIPAARPHRHHPHHRDHRLVWPNALFTRFVRGEVLGGAVIGGMLSISSTAVAMKMMEDAGERRQRREPPWRWPSWWHKILRWYAAASLITNALGRAAASRWGPIALIMALKLALALFLLGGFIAILGKIKSFRFPGSEYLLRDFDVGTLGVLGICFAAAAASASLGLSSRRWVHSWAGWRWATPRSGAERSPWPSRCRAFFCSCSSFQWDF